MRVTQSSEDLITKDESVLIEAQRDPLPDPIVEVLGWDWGDLPMVRKIDVMGVMRFIGDAIGILLLPVLDTLN
jgi:hypothetical protein